MEFRERELLFAHKHGIFDVFVAFAHNRDGFHIIRFVTIPVGVLGKVLAQAAGLHSLGKAIILRKNLPGPIAGLTVEIHV